MVPVSVDDRPSGYGKPVFYRRIFWQERQHSLFVKES